MKMNYFRAALLHLSPVCTKNFIYADDVMESPKLAE
jgi:hypothetical protein